MAIGNHERVGVAGKWPGGLETCHGQGHRGKRPHGALHGRRGFRRVEW